MLKREMIVRMVKTALSLLLVLTFVVGCSSETQTTKKKKKVIKVIVQSDDTASDNGDNNDYDYDSDISDSYTDGREKRPLAEKETDSAQTAVVPEYSVNVTSWNGPDGYIIVYPNGSRSGKAAAEKLQTYFKKYAGVTLSVTDDRSAVKAKEILVGDTNRAKSKLGTNEYAVSVLKEKLFFEGGHFAMVETAVDWFVSLKYAKGKANLVTGKTENFLAVVKKNYEYVWGDEFGGSSLDMAKWCFEDKMAGSNLMPCLRDENVININEGLCKLTAIRYYNAARPAAQYATNSSLCTQDTMGYKYGYLEIRARVPFKQGAWPSFWLVSNKALGNKLIGSNSQSLEYNVEIDVFEVFSSLNTVVPNIHKWYANGDHSMYNSGKRASENFVYEDYATLSNEYHTYGFEWTPEKMIMSVDGKDYMTYDLTKSFDDTDMDGFNKNLFVIFNNFIYVSDAGHTTASNLVNNDGLPFEYFIDYVRLYQIPGVGSLNFAD
ncbi:MAG: glycoside hydrolase family 16 protein [Clostridia bacterium]|nr:glycoside hydrolase family 16 protein [Clostridia bacterium]